jgi:hypothetical protein
MDIIPTPPNPLKAHVIKLSRNNLKGWIFITVGQRPAGSKRPLSLPERQQIWRSSCLFP